MFLHLFFQESFLRLHRIRMTSAGAIGAHIYSNNQLSFVFFLFFVRYFLPVIEQISTIDKMKVCLRIQFRYVSFEKNFLDFDQILLMLSNRTKGK